MKAFAFSLSLMLAAAPAAATEVTADTVGPLIQLMQPDIAVLGEVHDNPIHHLNQAAAIRALKPKALVFEMLTPDQAAQITPALRKDPKALAQAIGWEEAGWPDFAIYAPIFQAAPDALIIGAALPRDELRTIMAEPIERYLGVDAAGFGVDQPYPPELQKSLEDEAQRDHCNALPPEALPKIVEAQRLRDAVFTRTAMRARKTTGGPVAVITGTGHTRTDLAVPHMLRKALPGLKILALGQVEQAEGEALPDDLPYDFWIVTDPAPREDPCLVFQKG
ncbi:ChaN family lipoprotein [Thioclava sp. A2]|uniref:ChaN family lipoprotein n=1 Tax=Thioclava sp. FCG-A2 TaxID=3080562 RepID=UPI00295330C2|nr:ChaN family lipoprotein [Thioclava sp. A2]MDV7271788.1 ChaN family lipoprotein [Thioclava sp. A2]